MGNIDYGVFFKDLKTQSSVIHQLLQIGEAVKYLSDEFKNNHPMVPWRKIAGMRDRLIHQYHNIDIEEVWDTVTLNIPQLIEYIEPLVPPEEE